MKEGRKGRERTEKNEEGREVENERLRTKEGKKGRGGEEERKKINEYKWKMKEWK